jgi:hypothetical protein
LWENFFTLVPIQKEIAIGKSGLLSERHLADHLIALEAWENSHLSSDDNLCRSTYEKETDGFGIALAIAQSTQQVRK